MAAGPDALKLAVYFGERDRVGGRFLADLLLDRFAAHRLRASILLRGAEGFGIKHRQRTDRLLSLSEDLPLVAVAVDARERIEALVPEIEELAFDGLVTLERARLVVAGGAPAVPRIDETTKLTAYVGRGTRIDDRPLHEEAVAVLRRHGVDGATVLLGVDGTIGGTRRRAGFFAANAEVPAMVISVGAGDRIATALQELEAVLDGRPLTFERVRVLKRDGERLADLEDLPEPDEQGRGMWRKLILYASEQTHFGRHPVHIEAIRSLRRRSAAGATALRGVWGYHGDHVPHGEAFWSLRRRVPTVTVVVDRPGSSRGWFELLDRLTPERGLITSEVVPAFRATGPGISHGGLRIGAPDA